MTAPMRRLLEVLLSKGVINDADLDFCIQGNEDIVVNPTDNDDSWDEEIAESDKLDDRRDAYLNGRFILSVEDDF
ncbi:MAG: hypothetical protein DMG96_01580 [Acidobacteria bacterium]|nr:MAG: hypothetical protein DMG96_01580 [Acidobacteriota bacterium]